MKSFDRTIKSSSNGIYLLSVLAFDVFETTSGGLDTFGMYSDTELPFRPLGVHGTVPCSLSDNELVRLLGGKGFTFMR